MTEAAAVVLGSAGPFAPVEFAVAAEAGQSFAERPVRAEKSADFADQRGLVTHRQVPPEVVVAQRRDLAVIEIRRDRKPVIAENSGDFFDCVDRSGNRGIAAAHSEDHAPVHRRAFSLRRGNGGRIESEEMAFRRDRIDHVSLRCADLEPGNFKQQRLPFGDESDRHTGEVTDTFIGIGDFLPAAVPRIKRHFPLPVVFAGTEAEDQFAPAG